MPTNAADATRRWVADALAGRGGATGALWRAVWTPASWLYAAVAHGLRAARRRRAQSVAGVCVVSVGNLTLGGTGKTPCIAWLAQAFAAEAVPVAIVTRGYGGRGGAADVHRATPDDAARCGDEAAELAAQLGGAIPVFVARDRMRGTNAARTAGAEVILLDDAFHLESPRPALRILLVDAERPWGSGRCLPAGDLREPVSATAAADIVVFTRATRPVADEARAAVSRWAPSAVVASAIHRPAGITGVSGGPVPAMAASSWWLLCGVARPDDVERAAIACGARLVGATRLADHASFSDALLGDVARRAAAVGARVLMTAKDAARLTAAQRSGVARDWAILHVAFAVTEGEDQMRARMRAVAPPRGL